MSLIAPLFSGPIDVVGDIHGEIDALEALLKKLGYRADGRHPRGRRLVFLGDLIDRGPDSPAVLEKVMGLVVGGRAQCILGNHEVNLLRGSLRYGNEWFAESLPPGEHRQRPALAERRDSYLEFLRRLPIALEREDLRVVHACWHSGSIERLRAAAWPGVTPIDVYAEFERVVNARIEAQGLWERWRQERETYGEMLKDRAWPEPIILQALAAIDETYQMGNPVRVLTSGVEGRAPRPFWASGKWRMVMRRRWWEDYDDAIPVIVGHYWRRFAAAEQIVGEKFGPDLFAGVEPHQWMGRRGNVYCVDFSVGGRSAERGSSRGRRRAAGPARKRRPTNGEDHAHPAACGGRDRGANDGRQERDTRCGDRGGDRGAEPIGADASLAARPYVCQLAAVRVPEWEVVHDDHDEVWALGRPGDRVGRGSG